MSGADDLSGEWSGVFNYPAGAPPTGFTATLEDAGGTLTGSTAEPGLRGGTITARIGGRRSGSAIAFLKLYDEDGGGAYDAVAYQGAVDADGTEIVGRWSVPGDWSGTFIMVRNAEIDTEVAAEAEQRVR